MGILACWSRSPLVWKLPSALPFLRCRQSQPQFVHTPLPVPPGFAHRFYVFLKSMKHCRPSSNIITIHTQWEFKITVSFNYVTAPAAEALVDFTVFASKASKDFCISSCCRSISCHPSCCSSTTFLTKRKRQETHLGSFRNNFVVPDVFEPVQKLPHHERKNTAKLRILVHWQVLQMVL